MIAHEDASPSKIAAGNELLRELYRRSAEDRLLAELRVAGIDWATIGQLRGATPDSVRKQLARAIERVGHQMGLGPLAVLDAAVTTRPMYGTIPSRAPRAAE